VDKAESEPELAMAINGTAPGVLAEEARRLGSMLVHYSTDYVFDGTKQGPYVETDAPNPLNVYAGRNWRAIRPSSRWAGIYFDLAEQIGFMERGGSNFLLTILRLAKEREELRIVDDQNRRSDLKRMHRSGNGQHSGAGAGAHGRRA